uniref:Uncharacterized protein n=1 Tax=Aplanochytrium stocchinoi TaxID=215587 RepID=A0A7S3V1F0_9STRA|mmetsp:Transcript_16713/g.20622  ORF Transcript_16713/g.20622 Transcript_16713/m.20622 type:complete len:271 (+) Transcript_16713:498-1310(+)
MSFVVGRNTICGTSKAYVSCNTWVEDDVDTKGLHSKDRNRNCVVGISRNASLMSPIGGSAMIMSPHSVKYKCQSMFDYENVTDFEYKFDRDEELRRFGMGDEDREVASLCISQSQSHSHRSFLNKNESVQKNFASRFDLCMRGGDSNMNTSSKTVNHDRCSPRYRPSNPIARSLQVQITNLSIDMELDNEEVESKYIPISPHQLPSCASVDSLTSTPSPGIWDSDNSGFGLRKSRARTNSRLSSYSSSSVTSYQSVGEASNASCKRIKYS